MKTAFDKGDSNLRGWFSSLLGASWILASMLAGCIMSNDNDSIPSGFTDSSTEICDGADSDGNGQVDEGQTGWPGFCDRNALVPLQGYAFQFPLTYWQTAFDTRRDDPGFIDSRDATVTRADSSNPCKQEPYDLHRAFKALLTMYWATGQESYLEEAVDLADRMIAASDVYDPEWAAPVDTIKFDAWVAQQGTLRYWESPCYFEKYGQEYRYQLNELQGLRGISRLARVLAEIGDDRWHTYFDYADQVVSFYAMIGGIEPQIDISADKREHYVMNALDLFRASGEQRLLDWAMALNATLTDVTIADAEDADYVQITVAVSHGYEDMIRDVSHANRCAELLRYWEENAIADTQRFLLPAVNTMLFRFWENDPKVALPADEYPHLYRNFTDGANGCVETGNPPYRMGNVTMGWHELSRYDRRILYLMETLTHGLVEQTVIIRLPAADGCVENGNTNYSNILPAIAEMAYAHTYGS
jgi:hypothetical protein